MIYRHVNINFIRVNDVSNISIELLKSPFHIIPHDFTINTHSPTLILTFIYVYFRRFFGSSEFLCFSPLSEKSSIAILRWAFSSLYKSLSLSLAFSLYLLPFYFPPPTIIWKKYAPYICFSLDLTLIVKCINEMV